MVMSIVHKIDNEDFQVRKVFFSNIKEIEKIVLDSN